MVRLGILLFATIALFKCTSVYKVHEINGIDINAIKGDTNFPLRIDGLYSLYDTTMMECGEKVKDHYIIYSPLIFINQNNAIWDNNLGYLDNKALSLNNYEEYPRFENNVGVFKIRNDTIIAKLPINLYGGGMRQLKYEAYFQGVIKNKNTIVDWHIIPPYPKANKRLNDDFQFLKTPHTFHFIEGKELIGLNSLYQQRLKQGG